ncbi:MAG: hypothetical protein HQ495_15020 [Alphaproteobacteria bacterium]|nr:hypothetical protein [Alphaproteobacteria bacterium]
MFVLLIFVPINNQDGFRVSPLTVQTGTDINFYQQSLLHYEALSARELLRRFSSYYDSKRDSDVPSLRSGRSDYFIAPPLFPLVLKATGYRAGNTLPLGLLFLAVSCGAAILWIRWMISLGIPTKWLVVFGLLPNPIWFTVSISTDMLFAASFCLFFLAYFSESKLGGWRTALWILALIVCVLSRPNGVSLIGFVALDYLLNQMDKHRRYRMPMLVGIGLAGMVSLFFFTPHFVIYLRSSAGLDYFGITQQAFLDGAFDSLPPALNHVASYLVLLGSKLLYLVGLRPSYGDISPAILFVRAAPGLLLLPGLVFVMWRGGARLRLLIFVYLLPALLGATQDRYNLPIYPILFAYGVLAIDAAIARYRGKPVQPIPSQS